MKLGKRLLSAALSTILLLSAMVSASAAVLRPEDVTPGAVALSGDVNGDGKVDTTDARLVLQHAVGKSVLKEEEQMMADVNGDGRVDTTDARLILQYTVGKIELPANELLYEIDEGKGEAIITGYQGENNRLTLPEHIKGYPVTTIQSLSLPTLVSITIPSSVTFIKDGAFYNCIDLKYVYFKGACSLPLSDETPGLEGGELTVPPRQPVFNHESTIILYCPQGDTSWDEFERGKFDVSPFVYGGMDMICRYDPAVTTMPTPQTTDTFIYHIYDNQVTLNRYIGNASAVVIPDYIDDYPVTGIGRYAFADCPDLVTVTGGNNVVWIGGCAFSQCSSLVSLICGNKVVWIGSYAFGECISATTIVLGNNVTTICNYAFHGCEALKSLTIPASVTSIGFGVFENYRLRLSSIYFEGSLPNMSVSANIFGMDVVLYCPRGNVSWDEIEKNGISGVSKVVRYDP